MAWVILDFLSEGMSPAEIQEQYPVLTDEDVRAAVAYRETTGCC